MTSAGAGSRRPTKTTSKAWGSASATRSGSRRSRWLGNWDAWRITWWCGRGSGWRRRHRWCAQLGVKRLVRDVFAVNGLVERDGHGRICRIVLNQAHCYAHRLRSALQTLVGAEQVVVIDDQTAGNPYILISLLYDLEQRGVLQARNSRWILDAGRLEHEQADVPATVQAMVLQRVRLLPLAARNLLDAAAAIGGEFDL